MNGSCQPGIHQVCRGGERGLSSLLASKISQRMNLIRKTTARMLECDKKSRQSAQALPRCWLLRPP